MIKKYFFVIIGMILISLVMAVPDNYNYDFEISYDDGEVDINRVDVVFLGNSFDYDGDYYIEITDVNGELLDKTFFEIPIDAIREGVDDDGEIISSEDVEFDETSFNIFVPYLDKGYWAMVYNREDVELDRILIGQYSEGGVESEDFDEVVEDDESVFDPNESSDVREDYKNYVWILLIVLILLIIVLIYSFKKKK